MKTHIIRNTRVGISSITSVFARSMTTWALDAAQEDKYERSKIAFKAIKNEEKILNKMADHGWIREGADGTFSEKDVQDAHQRLDSVLESLAKDYDIEL